jgi:hypothetical protein
MSQPNPPQQYPPQQYPPQQYPPQQQASVPTYQTEVVVLLSLLCCFPLGLVFLWTSPRFSQNAKIGLSVVIGLFVVIAGVGGNNGHRETDTSARRVQSSPPQVVMTTASPNEGAVPVPTAAPAPPKPTAIVIPVKTLLADYKGNEVRADGTYKGKIVQITGVVHDVKRDILGSLYVTVGSGAAFELPVAQCFFEESAVPKASQLNKGDRVTVRGRVEGLMMNVLVKDADFAN